MDKRTALSSPRILEIKKRKRRVLRNRAIFFSVILVLVFIGLVFFSRWKEVNIVNIEISGNKIVETNLIKAAVEEELAGRYLWLFPKSNSFIYPRSRLQYELNNKFKRLKDLKLEVKELKTLSISVTELEGKYTWCGENLNDGIDIDTEVLEDSCYFIDKTGYIFDHAPYFSGSVYFKFFGKISNMENGPIGRYFAPDYFENLVFFKDSIVGMGLKPYAFYVRDDGDIELYLQSNVALKNSPKIIFKSSSDIVKLVENLHSTVLVEPLKTDLKTKYNSLKYIDLRFGNKIYYKFE